MAPRAILSTAFAVVLGASFVVADEAHDVTSLLQQPPTFLTSQGAAAPAPAKKDPFLIGLRRESVPIYRKGKVASFKTSYSGVLNVGTPAQEFRVVFDTGSGNIVLPAAECKSEACLMPDRRRFNMSASSTAMAINANGRKVPEGEACDEVTIGFGTGEIRGELTRDQVCFGSPEQLAESTGNAVDSSEVALSHAVASSGKPERTELCVEMSVILAVEMSSQPFKTFRFDGILGLGLDAVAISKQFSAPSMLFGTGLPSARFGVFLSEGEEEDEESQIAMGGVDERRFLEPLHFAPVVMPEHGHWQVPIIAVRVNGIEMDVCKDGTCRGVVDTGTSHLGVPAPHNTVLEELLMREAFDTLDCRLIEGPEVQIEIPGYNLTLHPGNYMRRLPLREGVSVSSATGVQLDSNGTNATPGAATAAAPGNAGSNTSLNASNASAEEAVRRFCRPRLMPVRLPPPLGPKLFILGEPVLHRYYTVYDWENHQVGFSLANIRRNTLDPSEIKDRIGVLPKEVDMLLMQERMEVKKSVSVRSADGQDDEVVSMMQVTVKVSVRSRRL